VDKDKNDSEKNISDGGEETENGTGAEGEGENENAIMSTELAEEADQVGETEAVEEEEVQEQVELPTNPSLISTGKLQQTVLPLPTSNLKKVLVDQKTVQQLALKPLIIKHPNTNGNAIHNHNIVLGNHLHNSVNLVTGPPTISLPTTSTSVVKPSNSIEIMLRWLAELSYDYSYEGQQ